MMMGWGEKVRKSAKNRCFFAKNASALIFQPGFLQLFAGQNDRPEFGRGGGAKNFG
jgi:hypothetical protein